MQTALRVLAVSHARPRAEQHRTESLHTMQENKVVYTKRAGALWRQFSFQTHAWSAWHQKARKQLAQHARPAPPGASYTLTLAPNASLTPSTECALGSVLDVYGQTKQKARRFPSTASTAHPQIHPPSLHPPNTGGRPLSRRRRSAGSTSRARAWWAGRRRPRRRACRRRSWRRRPCAWRWPWRPRRARRCRPGCPWTRCGPGRPSSWRRGPVGG